jgi:hypothetical protein
MDKILLSEYAKQHNIAAVTARQKAQRGGYKTAEKIGRDWFIDSNEPHEDNRIKSGKYVDWRKSNV